MGTVDAFDPLFAVPDFDFAGQGIHPGDGLAGQAIVGPAAHPESFRRVDEEQDLFFTFEAGIAFGWRIRAPRGRGPRV